ncbi:hypothetical protein CK203_041076 [Vitis vinifera]|uniref:GAG-pre-integrase domain-containing protein n=1 Tax=Vitis vinifera TaxID=29760 RepID=A0A438H9Y4_VITVI|nr:hypothetical protein CK203_041076 [Vitis vinifera]
MASGDEQPPLSPPKREMNSPFFLGTGDRPGDFITPTRLRGDNYDDWASDIQLALEAPEQWKALAGLLDHTRELIGTGVRRDGLYYFGGAEGDSVQHVSVHNAASTLELWHNRMGHPSEK